MAIRLIDETQDSVLDVTEKFSSAVKAEKRDQNVLIVRKLEKPHKRFDKKLACYEVEYRWLPQGTDDVHRCQGNEFSYWTKEEIDLELSLFDQLQLF